MKALLLNPPGDKIYLRDYYCSKTTKSRYYYHPVDLLYLSGWLEHKGYSIEFLDAQIRMLGFDDTINKISNISPDLIYSMIGQASLDNDSRFFGILNRRFPKIPIYLSGDIFMTQPDEVIKEYFPYLKGIVKNFMFPFNNIKDNFSIPLPRHDIIHDKRYFYPFLSTNKFATVLTDYGCPFNCSFCLIGKQGYFKRNIQDVIRELKYIERLGKQAVYFSDQNFTALPERTIELCRRMKEESLIFEGVAFARLDQISEVLLDSLRRVGIKTLIFGIESFNQKIRYKTKKLRLTDQEIINRLKMVKKYGIRTAGTFILGISDDSYENWKRFLIKLPLDYISFNIFVNRNDLKPGDQSGDKELFDDKRSFELIRMQKKLNNFFYFYHGKIFFVIKNNFRFILQAIGCPAHIL